MISLLKALYRYFKPRKDHQRTLEIPQEPKIDRLDYTHEQVEELPDNIKDKLIYIVGEDGYEWMAAFKCPCGCNELIQLNLLYDTKPCWRVIYHKDGKISISPSVHRVVNCKSHFTISRNMVGWWGLASEGQRNLD